MNFPRLLALATFAFALSLHAQVPPVISYQGRVVVGTTNFNGAGQFKFALVNGTGSTTFWSNDGTSVAGSEPTAAVTLTVTTGLYSVLLGDATLTNMTVIPNTVFNNPDVRLRVWFNDGTNGFHLLTPDQRIAAVGYAMMAANATTATIATTVPDGSISSAKLDSALASSFAKLQAAPLEFVTVGNTANIADPTYGAVNTIFQMGKYEVTNEQYAEFLNSVAMTDTNGLYDPLMWNQANGGIIREGYPGKYAYFTKIGMRFKPAVFVKWHSAIRFCNWVTNGKPTGAQGDSTTETGAYTITGSGPNWTVAARTAGTAKYHLPTENEWYKAAYHKNDGNTANYWLLPTGSNTLPNGGGSFFLTSIGPLYNTGILGYPVTNCANFRYSDGNSTNNFNDGYAVTRSDLLDTTLIYVTDAGLYTLSPSAYGTFDQGGNVAEWTETSPGSPNRIVRGGAWDSLFSTGSPASLALRSNIRSSVLQSSALNNLGFRVTYRP